MNALDFDLNPGQGQVFEGQYNHKMNELIDAGFTPWSTEDIMRARNTVLSDHNLWDNSIYTDFGIARIENKLYLAPHSVRLRAVTPKTILTNGGLPLSVNTFDLVKTYNISDLILNRDLTAEEARGSPVWLDFADNDQNLLDEYVDNTFRFGKDRFGYDNFGMGIFVLQEKKPVERAVMLNRLSYRSLAYGYVHLGNYARFVGVRRGGASRA